MLAFTRRPGLPVAGLRPVGLFATCLLVRIVLLLGRSVTTATAAAATAAFLASALGGTIPRLTLFHGGQRRILTRWPLLRWLRLTILLRLALALFLAAVASLIATVAIRILARTTTLLVALAGVAAAVRAACRDV